MREEQIFAKTLEELSALAKEQGNMLSEEQVTEAFDKAKLNLGEPQLEMIFAYLKNKKIGIGQPADPFDYMTREEIDYLEEYLKAVQAGADVTDGVKEAVLLSAMAGDADAKHRMIEIFLPQVAEIRWMLEELRVSFFAQELRTPYPVSAKRLDKVWAQLQQ